MSKSFVSTLPRKEIAAFCKRWSIRSFALFGSVLRDDFKPDSDIDVLIAFNEGSTWGLFDHVQMKNELQTMLGRNVDLVTRRALEQTRNHLLRKRILETMQVIFTGDETIYA